MTGAHASQPIAPVLNPASVVTRQQTSTPGPLISVPADTGTCPSASLLVPASDPLLSC